jgi:chromosome segregation ATPase
MLVPTNDKKVFFRKNLIGGFNRADVIDYLASLSREQVAERDELKRSLFDSTQKNRELSERLASYENEFVRLNRQLAEKENLCMSSEAEIGVLKKQSDENAAAAAAANEQRLAAEQKLDNIYTELRAVAGCVYADNSNTELKDEQISKLNDKLSNLIEENARLTEKVNQLSEYKNKIKGLLGILTSDPEAVSEAKE